jgi:hypothetical protein
MFYEKKGLRPRCFQATVEYLRSCTSTTINVVVAYKKIKNRWAILQIIFINIGCSQNNFFFQIFKLINTNKVHVLFFNKILKFFFHFFGTNNKEVAWCY